MFKHGDNIQQKLGHKTKYHDDESKKFLQEIKKRYDQWKADNLSITAFSRSDILSKVELLNDYKDFIDQQHYAEKFDSRSNLHSTVLEEFLYYLFKDAIPGQEYNPIIGPASTFKGLYFAPPNFAEMLRSPYALLETKDHDFVIGTSILAQFSCPNAMSTLYEAKTFQVPAIVIEVKTYLDKTMLEGASAAADMLKTICPTSKYFIVAEYLKLTESINLRRFKVDQIYILRKQKNVDREFRFLPTFVKNPIDPELIWEFFTEVYTYLSVETWDVSRLLERGKLL